MSMYADFYFLEEGVEVLAAVLGSMLPSSMLGIVSYVLSAMALYTLASRRGIDRAWMSWVPVLNVWILGSLSDQYRYVVKHQIKSKRKTMLVLYLLIFVISLAIAVVGITMAVDLFNGTVYGATEEAMVTMVMGPVLAIIGLALPLAGLAIAAAVVYFMALYDVFQSTDPGNAVLFLVLSILFNVTEPFFLFFGRNKDEGMPPRKPEPQWTAPEAAWQEPENKDYL